MIFESLYFRCFDHFSLFVCTNLTNNFRYFSIIFLRVLFSKYPGKNMHNFLYLFFIDIDLLQSFHHISTFQPFGNYSDIWCISIYGVFSTYRSRSQRGAGGGRRSRDGNLPHLPCHQLVQSRLARNQSSRSLAGCYVETPSRPHIYPFLSSVRNSPMKS